MRHHVTVLAGRPSYQPDERHSWYHFRRDRRGGLAVERIGSTAFHRRRMAGRITNYVSYLVFALVRAMTMRPKPDLIIAMTDPPLAALVGAVTALVRGCPFVYMIQDLHPDMAVAAGLVKPGKLVSLWERLHRWALKRAELLVVIGEDMRERIVAKGVDASRVAVVRSGAWPMDPQPAKGRYVIDEIRAGSRFVTAHAGNLGFAGSWDTLLEAARHLQGEDIRFVFIGDGTLRPKLEIEAKGLRNVQFLPFRPPDELPAVLSSADLHIVTIRRGLEGLVVPSKLYPVLMAGRPVLAVTPKESDVARIVQHYRCGLVADPDDPADVVRAVLWARDHSGELSAMGHRAAEAGTLFHRQALAEEFVRAIESVTSTSKSSRPTAPGHKEERA